MRRSADDLRWETIAVLDGDSTTFLDTQLDPNGNYVYRIVAQGIGGFSPYSSELTPVAAGPPGSSIDLAIDGLGVRTAETLGNTGPVQVGYSVVKVNVGSTPYGTAVFGFAQNGTVVSEAAVPASPPSIQSRIFVDFRTGVPARSNEYLGTIDINTGVAVVNTGDETAEIKLTLRNVSGQVLTSGEGLLPSGHHFAKFVNQLGDVAQEFDLPAGFPADTGFGSLELSSDQPLSVVALRLTTNQRSEALLTTTPVVDLTAPTTAEPLYFPQFADGDGFTSSLVLLNTSSARQNGLIRLFDDTGSPLPVTSVEGISSSVFAYSIPQNGSFVLETDGSNENVQVGWVLLTADPGSQSPVGAGVFQFSRNGLVVTESGIPSADLTTHARIFIDTTGGHNTGVAISNPGGDSSQLTLSAYSVDGQTSVGGNPEALLLEPGEHTAKFVTEAISGLPADFTGVLDIQSTVPIAALTLRSLTNGRGDFLLTTFPIADLTRSAPEPVIYPQIADGGGFATQFILINPNNDSLINLLFFNEEGTPLPVGNIP
jgi:hypothetical protein